MKIQHPQSTNATLSVDELAARWRVTSMTLRRWRKAGRLTAIQVGPRRIVFRVSDIEAFEAANRTQPTSNF